VWALTHLILQPMKSEGLYELYRQQAEVAQQHNKPQPIKTEPQPGSMEWFAVQNMKS
jgi:hypothetical protein